MNKRDNVLNLLNGQAPTYIPSGFWIHFPKEIIQNGIQSQIQAHLDFAQQTDIDIVKIMNECEFRSIHKISCAEEWRTITRFKKNHALFDAQKEIMDKCLESFDHRVYTLGTVHGLVASLSHSSGHSYAKSPEIMMKHAKDNEDCFIDALKITTENIINMLEVLQSTEVDAIYYAALGGEADRFPSDFFEKYIKPFDLAILNHVNRKIFLHMCKANVDLLRYLDYPSDVINWAAHDSRYDLQTGSTLFENKIILGGMDDRSGVLVNGTHEDIDNKIKSIKKSINIKKLILGADCTLPTEIDYNRIRYCVQAIR